MDPRSYMYMYFLFSAWHTVLPFVEHENNSNINTTINFVKKELFTCRRK